MPGQRERDAGARVRAAPPAAPPRAGPTLPASGSAKRLQPTLRCRAACTAKGPLPSRAAPHRPPPQEFLSGECPVFASENGMTFTGQSLTSDAVAAGVIASQVFGVCYQRPQKDAKCAARLEPNSAIVLGPAVPTAAGSMASLSVAPLVHLDPGPGSYLSPATAVTLPPVPGYPRRKPQRISFAADPPTYVRCVPRALGGRAGGRAHTLVGPSAGFVRAGRRAGTNPRAQRRFRSRLQVGHRSAGSADRAACRLPGVL